MNTRRLFVYSGLLALLITGTAFAGRYQRTKNGRTRVWNENPKPGDLVTWSGARDAEGYATGYGTLTWFAPQNEVETGSHIARPRHYIVTSRESGMMVHGKFEKAPANAEPRRKDGRTFLSSGRLPFTLKERRKNLRRLPHKRRPLHPRRHYRQLRLTILWIH